MIKVYKYNKGKLLQAFNKDFESLDDATTNVNWWLEARRSDQSTQFLFVDIEKDQIIATRNCSKQ